LLYQATRRGVWVVDVAAWIESFVEATREFAGTRQCVAPVVRITLYDGSHVFVHRLAAGPGDGYITISVYPDDPEKEMVKNPDENGFPQTPTVMMVPFETIIGIELRTEPPSRSLMGFGQGQ
jgi:hypothetical protein